MTTFTQEAGFATCSPIALQLSPQEIMRLDNGSRSRLRIDAARLEGDDTLVVEGYVASNIWIEARLPTKNWTQRLLVIAPGGYGGSIWREPWPASPLTKLDAATREFATVTYDTGHRGSTTFAGDALWAVGDPQAVIDFAYESLHKVVTAVRDLLVTVYGQSERYSYLLGMSSGGRISLANAQRYPEDFDGIASDCPTIDMVTTNTYWHAWNASRNTDTDGRPILTRDRLPGLHAAVLRAAKAQGAAVGNAVADPRLVSFDPGSLVGRDVEASERLTPEQAKVVAELYDGPRTSDGVRLFPFGLPLGSELAWEGLMMPSGEDPRQQLNIWNSSEMMYSNEFPDFMTRFDGPTGIRGPGLTYTLEEFDRLHALSGLYDPTNPDLDAFRSNGGKLLIWQGWADPASSPYSVLNYYSAARAHAGSAALDESLALFMVPGMYHGGMGPDSSFGDFLTPLMRWVESGMAPTSIDITFDHLSPGRSEPWPLARYISAPEGTSDVVDWYGAKHYSSDAMRWGVLPEPKLLTSAEFQAS